MELRGLSHYSDGPEAPLWWGFAGVIAIESAVFATLIVSFFYLRFGTDSWPPSGLEDPELLLPTINTVILIASSFMVARADRAARDGDNRRIAAWLLASIVFALAFIALKVVEYRDAPFRWDEHAYGSIVWTIIGFHTTHVIALVLKTVVVDTLAWRGYFTRERRLGVSVNGLYWHFVVIVWVPLYLTLYWVPRMD